jgi:hypothetical protein
MTTLRPLATAPESIDLADYDEVRTVGRIRIGDILSRDLHLMLVTQVFRTAKTIEFRAENERGGTGYGERLWISKHRSATTVDKALGSFTHVYRKRVELTTYTFRFDGNTFQVNAATKIEAFGEANVQVRAFGVTDNFAWFDAGTDTFVLHHNVLMD